MSDIFDFFEKVENKNWERQYDKLIKRRFLICTFLFPVLFFFITIRFLKLNKGNNHGVILAVGPKFKKFSLNDNVVVVSNLHDFFWNNNVLLPYELLYITILRCKKNKKDITYKLWMYLIGKLNVKLIVLDNDNFPLPRLIIKYGRFSNIKSITVQHGIWACDNVNKFELDGWYADNVFVYDAIHKQKLVDLGMCEDKIFISGFVEDFFSNDESKIKQGDNDVFKICILGGGLQNNELFDVSYRWNMKLYEKLTSSLNSKYYSIYYKPHPIEIRNKLMESPCSKVITDDLKYVIPNYDLFITMQSTAIISCYMSNKYTIQIRCNDMETINFENANYANKTFELEDMDSIVECIISARYKMPNDNFKPKTVPLMGPLNEFKFLD